MTDYGAVAAQIVESFNERDFSTLATLLHPSYEATWPHARLDLHHALLQEAAMLTGLPDLRFDIVIAAAPGDAVVVLETRARATHTGELRLPQEIVVAATGRRLDFPFQFVMFFEAGMLRRETLTFDYVTMLDQLGALTEMRSTSRVL